MTKQSSTRSKYRGRNNSLQELQTIQEKRAEGNKLGLLNGVIVPCLLNILGVVLFLYLGWSIAQAGVIGTIAIFCIGEFMAITTVLSLSAIVTNGNMRGGGSYFMISRSLGPEIGGSIGMLFYASYAVGCTFYVVGFATAVQQNFFPDNVGATPYISSVALFIVVIIGLLGAEFFTKVNTLFFLVQFGAIILGLYSVWFRVESGFGDEGIPLEHGGYLIKPNWDNFMNNLWPKYTTSSECEGQLCSFHYVFAIIFPAVTGIMEGANLSGDLADPGRYIGKGTLIAVLASFLVYLVLIFSYAVNFDRENTLRNNYLTFFQDSCVIPAIMLCGIVISTLSSALGALFGGSRVLQALARDNLFSVLKPAAYGANKTDEPRVAVIITWAVAQLCVFLGDLGSIAPIISSFFCLSYAVTNFACFILQITGAPNFRPKFRYFSWHTALLGTIVNLAVMFYLNLWYALISLGIMTLMFVYIAATSSNNTWGDVSQALIFHQVRKYLLRLDESKQHVKYWRPSVLLLSNDMESSLLETCNLLKKGGLYILGSVILGDFETLGSQCSDVRRVCSNIVKQKAIKAFPVCVVAESYRAGFRNILMSSGLGVMTPNTVVVPCWSKTNTMPTISRTLHRIDEHHNEIHDTSPDVNKTVNLPSIQMSPSEFVGVLGDVLSLNKILVVARHSNKLPKNHKDMDLKVDVWIDDDLSSWDDLKGSLSVLLQLSHILTAATKGHASLRVVKVTSSNSISSKSIDISIGSASSSNSNVSRGETTTSMDYHNIEGEGNEEEEEILHDTGMHDDPYRSLHAVLDDTRIRYSDSIVLALDNSIEIPRVHRLNELMKKHTSKTDVVFACLPDFDSQFNKRAGEIVSYSTEVAEDYVQKLQDMTDDLPATFLVMTTAKDTVITRDL